MDSHELANWLLKQPDTKLTVSVDIGTDDRPFDRVYGSVLIFYQNESDGTITIGFEEGCVQRSDN